MRKGTLPLGMMLAAIAGSIFAPSALVRPPGDRPLPSPPSRRDGWTDRRYRRAARKRANRIRNREAHRG